MLAARPDRDPPRGFAEAVAVSLASSFAPPANATATPPPADGDDREDGDHGVFPLTVPKNAGAGHLHAGLPGDRPVPVQQGPEGEDEAERQPERASNPITVVVRPAPAAWRSNTKGGTLKAGGTLEIEVTVTVKGGAAAGPVDVSLAAPAGLKLSAEPVQATPGKAAKLVVKAAADSPAGVAAGLAVRATVDGPRRAGRRRRAGRHHRHEMNEEPPWKPDPMRPPLTCPPCVRRRVLLGSAALAARPTPIAVAVPQRKEPVSYAKEVADVLAAKCVGCHSAALAENKLNLEEVAGDAQGGQARAGARARQGRREPALSDGRAPGRAGHAARRTRRTPSRSRPRNSA